MGGFVVSVVTSRMSRARLRVTAAVGALALGVAVLVAVPASQAQALSGSDFEAGYIISDAKFFDGNAMTESQIQSFLNARVGTCTNGNCINIKRVNTTTQPADRTVCAQYTGAANELASRIIFKVQQACGISAKVILATMQKETSLVSHSSPEEWRYERAMGYGCPDSSGGTCASQYYGLFNQVYNAAWQLKRYDAPGLTPFGNFHVGVHDILYHPNGLGACGAKTVRILNKATAALYNYTPYTPNPASLANLGTVGDACSSYGNRNFWYFYSTWFESPTTTSLFTVGRIAGADRYHVSAAISRQAFSSGPVPVVYVTTGENYPDALSAAPAAAFQGGPLLLTKPLVLPTEIRTEILRLQAQSIVVVGGPESVDDAVYNELAALVPAGRISRMTGADRYEASRALVSAVFGVGSGASGKVYIATGTNFPDALSASSAGGAFDSPVLLVHGADAAPDDATRAVLAGLAPTSITVVGGPASVSDAMVAQLNTIAPTTRINGADRFEASRNIATTAFQGRTTSEAYLATGLNFPDALAGAALAGKRTAPLIVVPSDCVPQATITALQNMGVRTVTLLGGPNTLTRTVEYLAPC